MKSLSVIIIAFIVISCSSSKQVNEKHCKSILKNDYQNIRIGKFKSIVNNDTVYINELIYECVYSPMYLQKGMFDRFGKWNQAMYLKGQKRPILLWSNVKLFPDDPTTFMVAANGLEARNGSYVSVLVSDAANRDLLSEDSAYKTQLINYFAAMIKTMNDNDTDFLDWYWQTVDPKQYELLKQNQVNK